MKYMLMGAIWTFMIVTAILYGCANGNADAVARAALEGAEAAFELCFSIGGAICLWCAVMELMKEAGLAERLAALLPTTIAAIRGAEGAAAPFDILPAVWISSAISVTVGLLAARLLEGKGH